mgnify:CR=1 FL=1
MVARGADGKFVRSVKQIVIGGNEMYVSLCRKHYNDGRLSDNTDTDRNQPAFAVKAAKALKIQDEKQLKAGPKPVRMKKK